MARRRGRGARRPPPPAPPRGIASSIEGFGFELAGRGAASGAAAGQEDGNAAAKVGKTLIRWRVSGASAGST
jgi:hypothetical protein